MDGLTEGEVTLEGLLRTGEQKASSFVPENNPEKNEWYSLDLESMAKQSGAQPVVVEMILGKGTGKTFCSCNSMRCFCIVLSCSKSSHPSHYEHTLLDTPSHLIKSELIDKDIPVGRSPVVELRNHHKEYIVTWYVIWGIEWQ